MARYGASRSYEKLDENDKQKMAELENKYHQWTIDYYKAHPMLGFLFELDGRLKGFHFNDTGLATMLDIYHSQYTTLYPKHPVHQRIAEQEAVGYQICGRKYNDYDVRTMDGQQVRSSDYYKDRLTLVICWASWCAPCIREACDIIPIYNEFRNRGLNVFSLAHKFKSTDAMHKAVERHAIVVGRYGCSTRGRVCVGKKTPGLAPRPPYKGGSGYYRQ